MANLDKDFEHFYRFIERCESGEIKYFIEDQKDQFRSYFQFKRSEDEEDLTLKQKYPSCNEKFSEDFPPDLSKGKTIRFSSFLYNRRIFVYEASMLKKEILFDYIKFVKKTVEEEEWEWTPKQVMQESDTSLRTYILDESGIASYKYLFDENIDFVDFWHHDEFSEDITKRIASGERLEEFLSDTIDIADEYLDGNGEEHDFYFVLNNGDVEHLEFFTPFW